MKLLSYEEFVISKTYISKPKYYYTPVFAYNEYYYIEILENDEFMLTIGNSSELNNDITILEHKLYEYYKEENQ